MNKNILNIEVQEFIENNLTSEASRLAFKTSPFNDVSIKEIIEQIEAKQRCIKKLPTWYSTNNIYFPNKLNIEQTSSELTARYKASLISGDSLIDITGGFGVDAYFFSKNFKSVIHCEIDKKLSKIVSHNYTQLKAFNIKTLPVDGIDFIKSSNMTYDCIYTDPSRRNDAKGKVFFLKDCLPNIPNSIDDLFKVSNTILLKTSPLLDISIGIEELKHIKEIHVVAVNNEVKELLWLLNKDYNSDITVMTINLKSSTSDEFTYKLKDEEATSIELKQSLSYLYEPNAAILKSGAFKSIGKAYNLFKLHQHSHLYTSKQLVDNFPGRTFKIEKTLNYSKKEIKREGIAKANITTRNFPESVQQIRKKFNIKDGGSSYLFFTTNANNKKVLLITSKLY